MSPRGFTIGMIVLAAALLPVSGRAHDGPPPWAGNGQARTAHDGADEVAEAEFEALDRFLTMSDAELDAMQQAIARVRAMSPDERGKLRAQIAAFRQLPEERRTEIRGGWGWHDARDREDWRTLMHAKPPEERAAIQRELQALAPEARMARKRAILEAWRKAQTAEKEANP